ncbi:MAG: hypothetical protein K5945_10560 [Bacteroidaceae bacterium]|nr:hypothetical protein [Bacteroidaceae bacterium]
MKKQYISPKFRLLRVGPYRPVTTSMNVFRNGYTVENEDEVLVKQNWPGSKGSIWDKWE